MQFARSDKSVIVGEAKPGESAPRRNIACKEAAWTSPGQNKDITTIYTLLKYAVKTYGDNKAMGWRDLIKTHTEEKEIKKKVDGKIQNVKKQWTFFEKSSYKYISYNTLFETITDLASGLVHIGLQPKNDRCHIYAATSKEWMQTALACNSQSIAFVTAYDTLGEQGLTTSLEEAETAAIVVDPGILHTLKNAVKTAKNLKYVIYTSPLEGEDAKYSKDLEAILEARSDIKAYSLPEVIQLGKKNPAPPVPPTAEDLACIMYTSGSSGKPKGVVLLNSNVIAGVAGVSGVIDKNVVSLGDSALAFLPLAHIFEFTFEMACFWWGCILGYGNPKTLSDNSMKHSKGDIREFRPTIMVAVPQVWETIRKGIMDKLTNAPWISRKLFWGSFYAKQKFQGYGWHLPLVDSFVFKKIKDATGGRVRYLMNGGAALANPTHEFMTTLIAPLLIGYGLTETNANVSLMHPRSFAIGDQGELDYSVTVKLIDVPDAGYYAKDGKGELLVKGGPVSPYYYKNEKETKEAYTDDGWFKTGDIAEWTPTGHIKIIDRRKNLVKTLHGEYIALERLESVYRTNKYVSNICVYADQFQAKPMAIIVPMEKSVHELCKELGIDAHEDVAHDKKIVNAIYQSLLETGRENGFKGVELLEGVVISKVEWSPQNGFLTSAQKLQRKKILQDNKEEVAKVYE